MSDPIVAASAAPAAPAAETPTSVGDAANLVADSSSPNADTQEATEGQQAEVAQETQAALEKQIKKEIKKWQLKSNGKEREVTDEAELVRLAQLGLGANEKFEQAAKTRKQAEQVLELLQTNPAEALKRLGMDVRKMAEDYLYQEIQAEQLTPEQKKVKDMETELEKYRAEKAETERKTREDHITKLQAQYEVSIQDNIIKSIEHYKLPNNPRTMARIAEYMAKALENGYMADPMDVAPRVRADLETEHKAMYSQYGVEDLLKIIGEDKLKQIRQYEVNKVKTKAPVAPTQTQPVAIAKTEESKPSESYTFEQMMQNIEKEIK